MPCTRAQKPAKGKKDKKAAAQEGEEGEEGEEEEAEGESMAHAVHVLCLGGGRVLGGAAP